MGQILGMEYLKDSCKTDGMEACESCQASPWKGPRVERIPRPYPDHSQLPALHHKAVWETPRLKEDGTEGEPDDYSHRSNLRCLFDKGDIHLDAPEEIRDLRERYVLSHEHVESYLTHSLTEP